MTDRSRDLRTHDGEAGFSLLELVTATQVLVIAVFALMVVIVMTHKLNRQSKEKTMAYGHARSLLAEIRDEKFERIYALYNDFAGDDPGGNGSAPGATFDVPGLTGVDGEPVGRIIFPDDLDGGVRRLREDVDDPALGMPGGLDLDGDGVIGGFLPGEYSLLPIRIEIRWREENGISRLVCSALMTER